MLAQLFMHAMLVQAAGANTEQGNWTRVFLTDAAANLRARYIHAGHEISWRAVRKEVMRSEKIGVEEEARRGVARPAADIGPAPRLRHAMHA